MSPRGFLVDHHFASLFRWTKEDSGNPGSTLGRSQKARHEIKTSSDHVNFMNQCGFSEPCGTNPRPNVDISISFSTLFFERSGNSGPDRSKFHVFFSAPEFISLATDETGRRSTYIVDQSLETERHLRRTDIPLEVT